MRTLDGRAGLLQLAAVLSLCGAGCMEEKEPPLQPAADAQNPDNRAPDASPEARNPDNGMPDASPDAHDPDDGTPDARMPDDGGVIVPDAAEPDAGRPEGGAPDAELTGVDRFRQIALTQGMAISHVRDLSTLVGPRLAGSAGDPKAVTWAVDKMKAIGLQNVRSEAVTVPRWERGEGHAELLGPTERPLAIAALGGSVGTPTAGIEAEVISVPSIAALNALPSAQVQGKIVFYNVITQRTKNADGYSNAVNVRFGGAAAAAQKGAVASILRSISTSMSNFPHTGQMNSASIPSVAISVADAIALEQAVMAGTVRVRLTLGCRLNGNAQSANVIGEVVGRERPNEIVLLGAHLDSWDLGTGALDDGAGVGMVLEAGRLLAQTPEGTLRTVRVVLFANEENGLSGANAYVSAHQAELARHVMALEADLGDGRAYGVTFLAGGSAGGVMRDLMAPLAPLGVAPPTAGGGSGSDLGPMRRQGVPVADILQDATTYFDYHHSAADKIESVDAAALTQATAAVAVFGYQLGRSTADLGRASLLAPVPDGD